MLCYGFIKRYINWFSDRVNKTQYIPNIGTIKL